MRGDGVLFSAEGASRAGVACCKPPLASSFGPSGFRSNDASMLRGAAIEVATVVFWGQAKGAVVQPQNAALRIAPLFGHRARPQHQARLFILLDEPRNERAGCPQQTFDLSGSTVGGAKPDNLGRIPAENASFLKVGILRDDSELVVFGILPNRPRCPVRIRARGPNRDKRWPALRPGEEEDFRRREASRV